MIKDILLKTRENIIKYKNTNNLTLYSELIEERLNKCVESYYFDLTKSMERLQNKRNVYLLKRLNSKESNRYENSTNRK